MKKIALILLTIISLHAQYRLVEISNEASCTNYKIVDANNKDVLLPKNITNALTCPLVAEIHQDILTFKQGNVIKQYNLQTKKEITLFKVFKDIDGVSNPVWSEDHSKIMFVILDQDNKYYKEMGRILVLEMANGKVTKKWKYDRPVSFVCGSICRSTEYVDFLFIDDKTIQYKRHKDLEDSPEKYETITLEN